MASPIGEIKIILAGEERTLRPSFTAMSEVESRLDKTLFQIADDMANKRISTKIIVALIYAGLLGDAEARGEKLTETFTQVGDKVLTEGITIHLGHAMQLFSFMIRGSAAAQPETEVEKKVQ